MIANLAVRQSYIDKVQFDVVALTQLIKQQCHFKSRVNEWQSKLQFYRRRLNHKTQTPSKKPISIPIKKKQIPKPFIDRISLILDVDSKQDSY